jgi:uncharacterized LabA/DUF88 family protein
MVRPADPIGSGWWGFVFMLLQMIRVCVYIDGFNFYHALVRLKDERVKWLDFAALSLRLIHPRTEKIEAIYYFSAYADWLAGPKARHVEYVKALTAVGVIPIMGHFKEKDRSCKKCGFAWKAHEEKETDVSIGIALLNDAYKNKYDKAFLVTRDSDLMPAVRMVRQEFPRKEIVAVAPPLMGHSNDLLTVCNSKKKITPNQVRACLLPQRVFGLNGVLAATRPQEL